MDQPDPPPLRGLGYRHMLVIILATYVLIIGLPSPKLGGPVRIVALGLILLVALRTRWRDGRASGYAVTLTVLLVAVTVVVALTGDEKALDVVTSGSTAVLVIVVIVVTGQALIAREVIDGPAVRGVLCVYLLFALLFGALNQLCAALIPGFLKGVGDTPDASETLYYSVITLATVGYGDITPGVALARALSVAEALLGQLYLVSVVAAVVSRYRRRPRRDEADPDS